MQSELRGTRRRQDGVSDDRMVGVDGGDVVMMGMSEC
jgi:hypothetical protein